MALARGPSPLRQAARHRDSRADRDAARDIAQAMRHGSSSSHSRDDLVTSILAEDVLAGHLVVVRAARVFLHRGDEVIQWLVVLDVERDPARACGDVARLLGLGVD